MDIAGEIFAKKRVKAEALKSSGFVMRGDTYEYREAFMNGDLTAVVTVSNNGKISGKAVDSDSGEEYSPMNVEAYTGSYVGQAREEFRDILERLSGKCFSAVPFISDQANRISGRIGTELGALPEFPFSKDGASDAAVYRHAATGKWFAILMTIARKKLEGETGDEMINIINVKIDPDSLEDLLTEPGLYRCYHMNKKMWLTISLDDQADDDRIMELISGSFELTRGGSAKCGIRRAPGEKRYWMIPSVPSHFDVADAFRNSGNGTISWHHRISVMPGDIVYIYQTEPIASIMFECEVTGSFLPRPEDWGGIAPNSKYRMDLRLLRSFRKGEYPRSWMNEHGVKKTVRGQRSAPPELVDAIGTKKD